MVNTMNHNEDAILVTGVEVFRDKEGLENSFDSPTQFHEELSLSNEQLVPYTCLVCNKSFNSKTSKSNIFAADQKTKFSATNLSYALVKVLDLNQEIQFSSSHLCSNCETLLNEWDEFLHRCENAQEVLLELYYESNEIMGKTYEAESIPPPPPPAPVPSPKEEAEDDAGPLYKPYSLPKTKQKRKIKRPRGRPKKIQKYKPRACSALSLNATPLNLLRQIKLESDTNIVGSCKCNYVAETTEQLEKHYELHVCNECNMFISNLGHMKKHLSTVHDIKPKDEQQQSPEFSCHLCPKRFFTKSGYNTHYETIHSNVIHKCKQCGMKFKHKKLLKIHTVRHQEKSVQCTQCSATFYHVPDLNKHINQVHRKAYPYKCDLCDRFFCQRSVLKHHMASHTGKVLHEPDFEEDSQDAKQRIALMREANLESNILSDDFEMTEINGNKVESSNDQLSIVKNGNNGSLLVDIEDTNSNEALETVEIIYPNVSSTDLVPSELTISADMESTTLSQGIIGNTMQHSFSHKEAIQNPNFATPPASIIEPLSNLNCLLGSTAKSECSSTTTQPLVAPMSESGIGSTSGTTMLPITLTQSNNYTQSFLDYDLDKIEAPELTSEVLEEYSKEIFDSNQPLNNFSMDNEEENILQLALKEVEN